ncbi:hypothetical protein ES703_107721 [subsurface metagenome]
MKELSKGIIVALLSLPIILTGSQKKELDYEFIRDENDYSFRGRIVVKTDLECLISILYDFKHLANIESSAKSIVLLQEEENWYEACHTFKKLFFKHESIWRKTLKLDEQKIVFEMISHKHNSGLMPKVLSSAGYYQIKLEEEGYKVEYFQECKLKSALLKGAYINKAKKETIKFMLELKEYIEKTCH